MISRICQLLGRLSHSPTVFDHTEPCRTSASHSKGPGPYTAFPRSQKQNWIAWLLGYDEFPRKNPDRNAQVVYNALNNANYVIWLGAAAGVDPTLIKRAIQRVAQQKNS